MKTGRVLFLNGTSSSGKTTLALELQKLINTPTVRVSLDDFMGVYLEPFLRNEQLSDAEQAQMGELTPKLVSAFHQCLPAFARNDIDIIVDHVLWVDGWLEQCLESLEGLNVFFIGLRCDLEELERREASRDRLNGTARMQYETVHADKEYDLEIHTDEHEPFECARQILAFIEGESCGQAFDKMRQTRG